MFAIGTIAIFVTINPMTEIINVKRNNDPILCLLTSSLLVMISIKSFKEQ